MQRRLNTGYVGYVQPWPPRRIAWAPRAAPQPRLQQVPCWAASYSNPGRAVRRWKHSYTN